jgi:vitamin K-dependent gamma-carboxylase
MLTRWRAYLLTPVDGASLAVFRVCFGALIVWEVWRYLHHGWIFRDYIAPCYFFSYIPFVRRWGSNGMYWHFLLMGVLAVLIVIGLGYRLATGLFCLAFSYVFLLDKTRYPGFTAVSGDAIVELGPLPEAPPHNWTSPHVL